MSAFPGAHGFGADTVGGRGGQILYVTNLNDGGAGSLREAVQVASGPRVVLFSVSGTISHAEPLFITHPYVTILGQTAPGDGICVTGEETRLQTHDAIIRHLRFRRGTIVDAGDGWDNADAFNSGAPPDIGAYNCVIDHCSFSFGVDETLTLWYESYNITVQYCLFSHALYDTGLHPKGPHSMGFLSGHGTGDVSFHHNLIANINQRNPRVANSWDIVNGTPTKVHDIRNNVVYNWGEFPMHFGGYGISANVVNNFYKAGPDTQRDGRTQNFLRVDNDAVDCHIYIAGNVDPVTDGSSPDVDNWHMIRSSSNEGYLPAAGHQLDEPLDCPAVPTMSAKAAYQHVLRNAGATRPGRDAYDRSVIEGVRKGTGRIIDNESEVGGNPTLTSTAQRLNNRNQASMRAVSGDGHTLGLDTLKDYADGIS